MPTKDEYRDAFRQLLARLLDYELGRPVQPVSSWLDDVIKRDAAAAVQGE